MNQKIMLLTLSLGGVFFSISASAHKLDDWASEIEQAVSQCRLELEVTKSKGKNTKPIAVDSLVLSFSSPEFFRVWSVKSGGFGSYGTVDVSGESSHFEGGSLTSSMTVLLPVYADKDESRPYTLYGYITLGITRVGWDGVKYVDASWVRNLPYHGAIMLFRYDTVNKRLYFSEISPGRYPKPYHREVSPDGTYFKVKGSSLSDSCEVRAHK